MRAARARALVIMGKAPETGGVKTRLRQEYSADAVVVLYRCLLEDTLALARSVRDVQVALMCPCGDVAHLAQWSTDGVQVVEQQGEGLAGALESTFTVFLAAGYRHVVAFNSDSPHLPARLLESAFALLGSHDLVIGPTDDGGYYLVGANAAHPGLFDPRRLGTESARDALIGRARELNLSVGFTEESYDVDVPDDLARLAAELRRFPERAPRTAVLLADSGRFRFIG